MSTQVEVHRIPSGYIRKYTFDYEHTRYVLDLRASDTEYQITEAEYNALLALEVKE